MKKLVKKLLNHSNKNLNNKKGRIGFFGLSVFLLFLFWFLATSVFRMIDPLFLPSPIEVFNSFVNLFSEHNYIDDVFMTTLRVSEALLLSIIIALIIALTIDSFKIFRKISIPYVDFLRYVPVPVLIPLMILFFGLGETSKVMLLVLGTVFQLMLLFSHDFDSLSKDYIDLSYTLHFSKLKTLKMKIMSALPLLYNDIRIALALAWSYVIIAELVSAQVGVGHMIKTAQRFSNTGNIYAGIITMALVGFFSDYILRKLYYVFFPYKR